MIVTAIERARPNLAGSAEIRLYQDWIAGNAGENPHLYAAWFNLGVALAREGDPHGAAVAYGKVRELRPTFFPAAVNLGLTLETLGQTNAALRTWETAIQTDEARTTLLNHRARLMEGLGRLDEAEATLRISLLTNPMQPDAVQHWVHIRQKMCRWPVLAADIPGLPPDELLRQSGPLAALALTDEVNVQCDLAESWIARKMPPIAARLSTLEGYRHDRIRVGYLSSDFCRHAMSYLIAELFERHDRSRFEIFGYCSTRDDGSDIRRRILGAFDHHRIIKDLSDEQAARLIRADEIDILIDLNGLTAHTRLAVLSWRPAPIQATYLGFVGPVPLPELDYLLCDDFVIPPGQVAAYRPKPLCIGRTYQANDSKRAIGGPLSRQEVGLPLDRFVFCCFSNHYKITEAMFGAWMSILSLADEAVLWLASDNVLSQANLRNHAARAGVAPERLVFVERCSPEVYMTRLGLADLFLDTFPYNAGTVASDAIRMKLPLLTLSGSSFASRMAGSFLHAIGAEEGIALNLSEYIEVATKLATDRGAYARYKQHFTQRAWDTTLGDIAGFTAGFEATLTQLMTKQSGHPSSRFDEPRPNVMTSYGIDVRNIASTDGGPDSLDVGGFDTGDCGLVDLITMAERMVANNGAKAGIGLYERWLGRHPTDALRHIAHFNQGTLLVQAGDHAGAVAVFAEAIRLVPTFLPPYVNAGLALEYLGRFDDAIDHWLHVADSVVAVDGEHIAHKVASLKHLARVFKNTGNLRRAEEALRRCLDIDPHQRDAIQHWIALREMQCKWPVIAPWGKLTRRSLMSAISPLSLAIQTDDPMYHLANAWRSSEHDVIPSPGPHTVGRWIPPLPTTVLQRRLRIGYVSPDLREHAVGFLTAELFELHNRAKVEVFAYFSGPGKPDAIQARIRQSVDCWRNIVGWSDKQTARQIVRDEIDIVIDLGGHTGGAPASAFRLRPAPVIVNWLGYPGSMGTPHHQYVIADETIIPASHEKYYSERVVRLPCYQPTDRKRIVAKPPSRREAGLADEAVVYCCFNGTQKITPAVFRSWMAILAQVPNAILWLLSCEPTTNDRLQQQAAHCGVAPERLVFADRKPNAEHLARYPLADLFLDTWPYGAHTTASDALWMGVPVLTLIGQSFGARVCASLVAAAGLPELVCSSTEAYEQQAVELATRPEMLRTFRERLRTGRDSCLLFNMPYLVTRLESLYEQMWNEYLSDQIPEPDLTNLAIYAEIADEIDRETAAASDLQSYARSYVTALACRHSLSPVQFDRRMWSNRIASLPGHPKAMASDVNKDKAKGNVMVLSVMTKGRAANLTSKVDEALNASIMTSDIDSNSGFYRIEGMSGRKYRYFINRLVSVVDQPRYLEIGSWTGSTLCAAIHGNDVDAVAIDNWSEFGGPKQAFLDNVALYKTTGAKVRFIEADFRHVNYSELSPRNIYLYDGPHDEQDQYDGLRMAVECLDRQFVFIVDDWNWDRVRSGTFSAIRNCGLNILFSAEIRTTLNGQNPDAWFQHSDWHNGYFIAVLEQNTGDVSAEKVGTALTERRQQLALICGTEQDDTKMVLHVGCGAYGREKLPPVFRRLGWREIRLDIDPDVSPDVVASITDMDGVPDGSFDAVFSSHNVEHLYPYEVALALREMRRVLKSTGFALLTLPDLQEVARHVAEGRLDDPLYASTMGPIAPLDILYGHRPSLAAGNLFMAHHTGFTADTLGATLIKAGFAGALIQRDASAFALTAIAFPSTPSDEQIATAQAQMLTAPDRAAILYTNAG